MSSTKNEIKTPFLTLYLTLDMNKYLLCTALLRLRRTYVLSICFGFRHHSGESATISRPHHSKVYFSLKPLSPLQVVLFNDIILSTKVFSQYFITDFFFGTLEVISICQRFYKFFALHFYNFVIVFAGYETKNNEPDDTLIFNVLYMGIYLLLLVDLVNI